MWVSLMVMLTPGFEWWIELRSSYRRNVESQ
jgi:hypothetical protein